MTAWNLINPGYPPIALNEGVGGWWSAAYGSDVALAIDFANNRTYQPTLRSTPTNLLTYTAPSPKMVYGDDGVLGYALHNLCLQSQTFGTSWNANLSTVTSNQTSAPDGSLTADFVVPNASGSVNHRVDQAVTLAVAMYTYSVYAKAGGYNFLVLQSRVLAASYAQFNLAEGTTSISGADYTSSIIDAGDGWYRCSITFMGTAASHTFDNRIFAETGLVTFAGDTVSGVYLWGAQLNAGSSALTYIPTTTAAVYSLPIDHNPTTFDPLGVLIEEQRTNLCLYSDDFTNAAWVKTSTTAAKTATGPDGVANSASTLTATGANGTALQTITSVSAARVSSAFVKRRTGTGDIEMTQDNGATWAAVTVTAGWTRVEIASATVANPVVGFRIVTSGDEIDVALFDQEVGAFITSPIPTVASQVTRAADQTSLLTSAFGYSATAGTFVANIRFADYTAGNGRVGGIVGIGGSSPRAMLYMSAGAKRPIYGQVYDGVDFGGDFGPNFTDLAVNTEHKTAFAYEEVAGGSDALTWNGIAASSTVHANTVTLPSVGATLFVGNRPDTPNYFNGHIKSLAYWPTRKSDTYLQQVTT